MSEEKVVEVKLEKNRIILEQVNKQTVNAYNFSEGNVEFYNYACFQILSKDRIRYFPFNKTKYLDYEIELPPITNKSAILKTEDAMDYLNKMLGSRMWMVWGQDEKRIKNELYNE